MLAIEFEQLSALGLTPALANRAAGLAAADGATFELLRVTVVHRSTLGVHDGRAERGARPLPRLARALAEERTALAVGDWVLATRDALRRDAGSRRVCRRRRTSRDATATGASIRSSATSIRRCC